MPLSPNEIKDRALAFSRDWADERAENAEAKSFLDGLFNVFGVPRRRFACFEYRVKKIDGKDGYIDLLWKGTLLIEQKSRGKNLDRAYGQATDYFHGIKDRDLPRYILVCDFARFRLYDLDTNEQHDFALADLVNHVHLFGFMIGQPVKVHKAQELIDIKASAHMGLLHDKLKAIGYDGHDLEVYLVRLLFCLFAEDTGIFEVDQFQTLIEQRTAEDGQDLAQWLANLFEVLNTPRDKRLTRLDEQLAEFEYINGHLYAERLSTAAFDRETRELLLDCCALNWGGISPAIFGALFQSVMKTDERRQLGAHYTSETNIRKLIGPLFLDDLRAEFERSKRPKKKLFAFHQKLASLKFLDPACGCGNFLIIAYRELRLLELDVLRELFGKAKDLSLGVGEFNILCNVDQFYGIEIEEFPAQIAQTAMWLMDHQMNQQVSREFGMNYLRLPLKQSATIVHGNALQRDWSAVVKPKDLSYILGNPPFVGSKYLSDEQRSAMAAVFHDVKGAGVLDFVAAWYRKATDYMADHPAIRTAFVSTNSISQGEQVGVLWGDLLKRGVKIHFAHRTFQWSSEAKGKAAVHCVIVGFALHDTADKRLFDYEKPQSEAHEVKAVNINPYLVDAPSLVAQARVSPLCAAPCIVNGSIPADGGHLILETTERDQLLAAEPVAADYIRPYLGADGFINNRMRYCLWLKNCAPQVLRSMPKVLARVEGVRQMREASSKGATREKSKTPTLFTEDRQPETGRYLALPRTSSENRRYIPIGYLDHRIIASNDLQIIPDALLVHFGVISSAMHMAWMRMTSGRLKSDIRYSVKYTYNNFPWPDPTDKQKTAIETAAQAVLDARARHPDASLASLYDPLAMPPELTKAHGKLNTAVDAAYAKQTFTGDTDRVAFLFERYRQLVSQPETAPSRPRPLPATALKNP